jgi:hypothetical protein
MLEQFTIETFRPLVGRTFRVEGEDARLELELVSADELGKRGDAQRPRAPFSLVFRGPAEPVLPQQIYRFENDALSAFEIFIVPIGPDAAGMQYEAVFS